MTPPWSAAEITIVAVAVEYEEKYDVISFNCHNNTVSPALQELATLIGRSFGSTYMKVKNLRKSPEECAHIDMETKVWNTIRHPTNNNTTDLHLLHYNAIGNQEVGTTLPNTHFKQ
jgi:hypothetical protein